MPKQTQKLTAAMLKAAIHVTRIESEIMIEALVDVLVGGKKVLPAAQAHGLSRQHLNAQVRHMRERILPAFEEYARLASLETKAAVRMVANTEASTPADCESPPPKGRTGG